MEVGAPRLAAGVLSAAPHLVAARVLAPGRWWTRDELRSVSYVGAWRRAVAQHESQHDAQPDEGEALLVLDHGPVFRLASLSAFGPPMAGTRPFDRWWTGLARDWGRLLDVVVYLDAPDRVLLRRIEARARSHRIRGSSEDHAAEFLARYRAAYRHTLDAVTCQRRPGARAGHDRDVDQGADDRRRGGAPRRAEPEPLGEARLAGGRRRGAGRPQPTARR